MGDNMNKTVGLIAATATVFHPDDSVNCDIIPSYAQMLHASGVAGVFVNGTTGEGMSLSLSDRRATAERWVNAAPEGFKVIIHVGHTCQQESCGLALHAARIGAAAVGEIGPVFYRPDTVDALADYIAATASAAPELPYYYYHMPSMNQIKFPMLELLKRMRDVSNFAGIKYTFEDLDDYERCIRFADGKYDVLFGRDERLLEAIRRGAQGAVGSTYGIMAPLYRKLTRAFHVGDKVEAQRLQDLASITIKIIADTGAFFSAIKAILSELGLDVSPKVHLPLTTLDTDAIAKLISDLKAEGAWKYINAFDFKESCPSDPYNEKEHMI